MAKQEGDYPWLADGVDGHELHAILRIALIAKHDPSFAERVLSFAWLADDITTDDSYALFVLSDQGLQAPELLDSVLNSEWVSYGIDQREAVALSSLYDFAANGGIAAAQQVMEYQWVADGATWEEITVIGLLTQLVIKDPEAARQISRGTLVPYLLGIGTESDRQAADYQWLIDGVNAQELNVVIGIAGIAKGNPPSLERLLGYAWLADDITEAEAEGIFRLSELAQRFPELVDRALKYTWMSDGITYSESQAFATLYFFAESGGVEAAIHVMDYQWLADGVTWDEVDLIGRLLQPLVQVDPEAARQITLGTLVPYLLGIVSESEEQAADYQWLADGLTVRELRAIIGIALIAKQVQEFPERPLGYS